VPSVGIIDTAAVPPVADLLPSLVSPVALANPYSGSGDIATSSGGVSAYGVRWSVHSFPPGAGGSSRAIIIFEDNWLSFALHYTLADASDMIGDYVLTPAAEGFHLFSVSLPASLHFDILPGWEVDFTWLKT
jgi:hypothetical protein